MSQLKDVFGFSFGDAAESVCVPGKLKSEKGPLYYHPSRQSFLRSPLSKLLVWILFLLFVVLLFRHFSRSASVSMASFSSNSHSRVIRYGGSGWEKKVKKSAHIRRELDGISVLVTGAAGFVGTHCSIALKKRGDGVVGLDSFNDYYDPRLKQARRNLLERSGVFIVEGDINDQELLQNLFDVIAFTHVLHLAAQAGVRYAMKNPKSYVHSNVAGLISIFEAAKSASPQPAIVWASSSSVYGLNKKTPFSEFDRTDRPASLYAATKKAGEEIAHVYNNIYGLSITGLRFFTVYGPWGRPDMAYFFFTRDILRRKPITIFEGPNHSTVARDFTYIDDVVSGCLGALDTAEKSTGKNGKKQEPAQLRVFNLGNTSPVPVSDLVGILESLLMVKADRKLMKMPRNGDVPYTHANISLARTELGYNPTTDLHTGLKKFVRWYLEYYSFPKAFQKKIKRNSRGSKKTN